MPPGGCHEAPGALVEHCCRVQIARRSTAGEPGDGTARFGVRVSDNTGSHAGRPYGPAPRAPGGPGPRASSSPTLEQTPAGTTTRRASSLLVAELVRPACGGWAFGSALLPSRGRVLRAPRRE